VMSENSRKRHGLIFNFEYPMKHLGCTLDPRFTTSGTTLQVEPDHVSEEGRILSIYFFSRFFTLVCLSPLFSFFTSDAHLFVTARCVLKLRNGGNPLQVRNVDNEYVELSNLQQPRSVCPQGPNARVSTLT
jgi:hypothetical protein